MSEINQDGGQNGGYAADEIPAESTVNEELINENIVLPTEEDGIRRNYAGAISEEENESDEEVEHLEQALLNRNTEIQRREREIANQKELLKAKRQEEKQKRKEELQRMMEDLDRREVEVQRRESRLYSNFKVEHNERKVSRASQEPPLSRKDSTLLQDLTLKRLQKDFLISGKIGEKDSDKDIGYLGVIRQIKEGREKGYGDNEIATAIIKAITPKSLKTYLSVINDISLPQLTKILRVHYQEKTSTELYQELITLKQGSEENAVSFVIRAFEIREKILLASTELGEVPYDKSQVERLCLSTLESGIGRDISLIVGSALRTPGVDDVEIMNEVRKAEAALVLRREKESKKSARIAAIPVQGVETRQSAKEESEILRALKSMELKIAGMEELKRDMKKMQGDLNSLKLQREPLPGSYSCRDDFQPNKYPEKYPQNEKTERTGRCEACVKKDTDCDHCFNCGSTSHWYRDCRRQGNDTGRPPKGR